MPPDNTASRSQINLAWTDNSNNESGFQIERSLNGILGRRSILPDLTTGVRLMDKRALKQGSRAMSVDTQRLASADNYSASGSVLTKGTKTPIVRHYRTIRLLRKVELKGF